MRKALTVVLLMALILNCFVYENVNAEEEWIKSSDNVFEVLLESVDMSSYPKADIKLRYRVDKNTENSGTWSIDCTKEINSFISSHPEYKNRKVKVEAGKIDNIECNREGIDYTINVTLKIGDEAEKICRLRINLWEEFPDDFIDYEVFQIAEGIKKYQSVLSDPEKLQITADIEKKCYKNDDLIYYVVPTSYNGSVRYIGIVCKDNGNFAVYDLVDGDIMNALYGNIRMIYRGWSGGSTEDEIINLLTSSSASLDTYIKKRPVINALDKIQ